VAALECVKTLSHVEANVVGDSLRAAQDIVSEVFSHDKACSQ